MEQRNVKACGHKNSDKEAIVPKRKKVQKKRQQELAEQRQQIDLLNSYEGFCKTATGIKVRERIQAREYGAP